MAEAGKQVERYAPLATPYRRTERKGRGDSAGHARRAGALRAQHEQDAALGLSGATTNGENEDNCDLCAAKGYAPLTAVIEWERV